MVRWLMVVAILAWASAAGAVEWMTETHGPGVDVTTFRGPLVGLAMVLAPDGIGSRARVVVVSETGEGGVVQAFDKRGRMLCAQVASWVEGRLWWEGDDCGW